MPACYGVCCHLHARCKRYGAVEQAAGENTMPTCQTEDDEFPYFVEREKELQQ